MRNARTTRRRGVRIGLPAALLVLLLAVVAAGCGGGGDHPRSGPPPPSGGAAPRPRFSSCSSQSLPLDVAVVTTPPARTPAPLGAASSTWSVTRPPKPS